MRSESRTIDIVGQAKKADKNFHKMLLRLLLRGLNKLGPYRFNCPNYTKMNQVDDYHFHLKKATNVCRLVDNYLSKK